MVPGDGIYLAARTVAVIGEAEQRVDLVEAEAEIT